MGPQPAGLVQLEETFSSIISVVVGFGFIALLVLLVWAGFKYITSSGEPKAIQQAHTTVSWAFLGILFLAIAWILLQLVEAFTGIKVTFFDPRILCEAGKWC